MHMAWLRYIGGRLESRYRYSIGLVYNPFPWPVLTSDTETQIAERAQAVLDARASYPTSTLADLYDPAAMPADLRKALSTASVGLPITQRVLTLRLPNICR